MAHNRTWQGGRLQKMSPQSSTFFSFGMKGDYLCFRHLDSGPPNERKREASENTFWFISCFESRQSICYAWSQTCVSHATGKGVFGETTCWCTTEFWQCEGELCFVLIGITHQGSVYSWQWTDRDLGRLKFILSVVPHTKFSHQFSDKTLQVIKTHLSQEGLSIPASL